MICFLTASVPPALKDYVMGAVDSCWCPDVVEDLEHHSPVLMREIEKQQDMLPDMKVKIGESLNNLNETIDLLLENIILQESKTASWNGGEIAEGLYIMALYAKLKNGWDKDITAQDVREVLDSAQPNQNLTWQSPNFKPFPEDFPRFDSPGKAIP